MFLNRTDPSKTLKSPLMGQGRLDKIHWGTLEREIINSTQTVNTKTCSRTSQQLLKIKLFVHWSIRIKSPETATLSTVRPSKLTGGIAATKWTKLNQDWIWMRKSKKKDRFVKISREYNSISKSARNTASSRWKARMKSFLPLKRERMMSCLPLKNTLYSNLIWLKN